MTAWFSSTTLAYIDPPRWPDERVFGPQLPDDAYRRPFPGHGYPYRFCLLHPGVQWYGTSDCWICKPGPT